MLMSAPQHPPTMTPAASTPSARQHQHTALPQSIAQALAIWPVRCCQARAHTKWPTLVRVVQHSAWAASRPARRGRQKPHSSQLLAITTGAGVPG